MFVWNLGSARGPFTILIDFWGPFSGAKWHFSDFKMHFWGFGVPGLCGGTGRLQKFESNCFGSAYSYCAALPPRDRADLSALPRY